MAIISILASLAALALTIVAFVLIIPKSKRKGMTNPFLIFLHDLFNFKQLWLEKIFKFLYVFSTISCITVGVPMIFWFEKTPKRVYYADSIFGYAYEDAYEWRGYIGILLVILGPIIARILFEGIMMFILLVKNTMDINKKLEDKFESPVEASEQRNDTFDSQNNFYQQQNQAQAQGQTQNQNQYQDQYQFNSESAPSHSGAKQTKFCSMCGHSVGEDGRCSFCGKQN